MATSFHQVDACEKDSRSGHDSESTYVEYGIGEQGYTFLKFEPLVLHVMCRTMESAQAMVSRSLVRTNNHKVPGKDGKPGS